MTSQPASEARRLSVATTLGSGHASGPPSGTSGPVNNVRSWWRRATDRLAVIFRHFETDAQIARRFSLSRWVQPYNAVMIVLFVSGPIIAWLVLPGEDERIAALEQDGQYARALSRLEANYQQGDNRPRTLFQLQKLYEFYGERDKARVLLEKLAESRPKDAQVQRQLAQLYKQTQDEPRYIKSLKSQLALSPRNPEPICRELIGLLRRNSEYQAEQATISDCRTKGYRRQDDLVRFAFMAAADGDFTEASKTLRAVDDRRWLGDSRERLLLFASLIEINQAPEALRRSIRWLRGQPDPDLALEMISMLTTANRNDLSLSLARQVGTQGDAISLAVAEIMVDQVQLAPARLYLAGWLDQKIPMDQEVATRFVTTALDAEDPRLALRGAETFGLANFDQATLAALGEAIGSSVPGPGFGAILTALTADTLAKHPLIVVAAEIRTGRLENARTVLSQIQLDSLDERQLQVIAALAAQAGRTLPSSTLLRPPPAQGASISGDATIVERRVVGPAQARAKSILRRVEAKRQKQRRRVDRPANSVAPGTAPAPGFVPIPFPNQQ
jgi:tetratricopeptide (TPR) repeat protein